MANATSWVLAAGATLVVVVACKTNTISSNETNNYMTQTVGPQGATIVGPDGASLVIPANALAGDTAITVGTFPSDEYAPAPADAVGKVHGFKPHGLPFLVPATIILPIPGGAAAKGVYSAADSTAPWTAVSSGVQLSDMQVRVSVMHLSYYVVVSSDSGAPDVADVPPVQTKSPFCGTWQGTFAGWASGTWGVTVSAKGAVSGSMSGTSPMGPLSSPISGSVADNGAVNTTFWSGQCTLTGTAQGGVDGGRMSGEWACPSVPASGTWQGTPVNTNCADPGGPAL